jgi:hypothetical protein
MFVNGINPILNVSNILESFAWHEKFGWNKQWDGGDPPTFGCVCSGKVGIFLCQNGQGGRGKSASTTTKNSDGDIGVWMSLWVDNVDKIHHHCLDQSLEVTMPPTDEPWGVRESHVRHPDVHVIRFSQPIEPEASPP